MVDITLLHLSDFPERVDAKHNSRKRREFRNSHYDCPEQNATSMITFVPH